MLVLESDNTFRLGTASHYHVEMQADGETCINTTGNNVGIGTDSPSNKLDLVASVDAYAARITNNSDGSEGLQVRTSDNDTGENILDLQSSSSSTGTDYTSRFIVTKSGSVLVGTTLVGSIATQNSDAGLEISSGGRIFTCTTASGHHDMNKLDDGEVFRFREATNIVGSISVNSSSTTYATSSDYRLKENVVTDWDATSRLKQLKPSRFNFKSDSSKTVDGFLAHEVSSIVPEAVTGTKDAVEVWKDDEELPEGVSVGDNKLDANGNTIPEYQGIDQAKLVPLLVKTIQELEARIAKLEGE